MSLSTNALLRIAAVVLFILAAIFGFGVGNLDTNTILGLSDTGLACWVLSTIIP